MRTLPGIKGDDGVSKASGGMCNGSGAIRHGIQLVEPAGLKAGGHEQQVRSSRDLVAHGDVEAHPASCPVRIGVLHPPHPRLQDNQHISLRSVHVNVCS